MIYLRKIFVWYIISFKVNDFTKRVSGREEFKNIWTVFILSVYLHQNVAWIFLRDEAWKAIFSESEDAKLLSGFLWGDLVFYTGVTVLLFSIDCHFLMRDLLNGARKLLNLWYCFYVFFILRKSTYQGVFTVNTTIFWYWMFWNHQYFFSCII